MKRIWILTLFPDYFTPLKEHGVLGAALRGERGRELELHLVDIKKYSPKDFKGVDAAPYGGGPGMVMRADILKNALFEGVIRPGGYSEDIKNEFTIIFPNPRGIPWNHQECRSFASHHLTEEDKDLVFLCGRYEGIDERFIQKYVDLEYSLGDFILTGGELATMCMIDSSFRFMPGVLGNKISAEHESFENCLLEHPQYTRPAEFEGLKVPEVLLSGHHAKIVAYQEQEKERLTQNKRPDLWHKYREKK